VTHPRASPSKASPLSSEAQEVASGAGFGSDDSIRLIRRQLTTLKEHNNEFEENCGAGRDRRRDGR
jgi:hypothetical protein